MLYPSEFRIQLFYCCSKEFRISLVIRTYLELKTENDTFFLFIEKINISNTYSGKLLLQLDHVFDILLTKISISSSIQISYHLCSKLFVCVQKLFIFILWFLEKSVWLLKLLIKVKLNIKYLITKMVIICAIFITFKTYCLGFLGFSAIEISNRGFWSSLWKLTSFSKIESASTAELVSCIKLHPPSSLLIIWTSSDSPFNSICSRKIVFLL